jgi:hypothetical protein
MLTLAIHIPMLSAYNRKPSSNQRTGNFTTIGSKRPPALPALFIRWPPSSKVTNVEHLLLNDNCKPSKPSTSAKVECQTCLRERQIRESRRTTIRSTRDARHAGGTLAQSATSNKHAPIGAHRHANSDLTGSPGHHFPPHEITTGMQVVLRQTLSPMAIRGDG